MLNVTSEYLSTYYFLKNNILSTEFVEQELNVSLSLNSSTGLYTADSIMDPLPSSRGRGWCYFDTVSGSSVIDTSQEQTSRVVVYKTGGGIIDSSDYEVNYVLGGVDYTGIGEVPLTVDYYFNYVPLLDAWPGTDVPELPVVSLDMIDVDKRGYQLGGGKENIRPVRIDIFAVSSRELRELTEIIYEGFYKKCILPLDFTYGEPLNYDGKYNTGWSSTINSNLDGYSPMRCDNVKARRVNLPVSYSDINRFRSVITFDLISYVE